MFGIGDQEFFLIVLFAFLLFGPDKLPGMGRTVGRMLRQFRTAQEGVSKVVQSEIINPIQNASDTPAQRAAQQAAHEDDDLSEEDIAAAKPAETFAERRARLAAQQAVQAQDSASTHTSAPTDSDSDADSEDYEHQDVNADTSEQGAPHKPAPDPTSAAALYGLDDDDLDEEDA